MTEPTLISKAGSVAKHDFSGVARQIFDALDSYRKLHVPPAAVYKDPAFIEKWIRAEAVVKPEDAEEFSAWLVTTERRRNVIEENARRLRATTWTQSKLSSGFDDVLAAFHRHEWGIDAVSADPDELDAQIRRAAR